MTIIGVGYGDLPYGDGSDVNQPTAGDECLVGTVTRLSSRNYVAQRSPRFGGLSDTCPTYPDAKNAIQRAVSQDLTEVRIEEPGQPQITYLYLATCAAMLAQIDARDGYGD